MWSREIVWALKIIVTVTIERWEGFTTGGGVGMVGLLLGNVRTAFLRCGSCFQSCQSSWFCRTTSKVVRHLASMSKQTSSLVTHLEWGTIAPAISH